MSYPPSEQQPSGCYLFAAKIIIYGLIALGFYKLLELVFL